MSFCDATNVTEDKDLIPSGNQNKTVESKMSYCYK